MSKIYLKLDKKPKTIKELLLKLFSSGDNNLRRNVITYIDEGCSNPQCGANKYRSYDDVYDIIRTYFPKATNKEIIHELLTLDFGLDELLYLRMSNCSTINRIVFWYDKSYFSNDVFSINQYNSKHSWKSLLELLEIRSIDNLKSYVNKYIKVKEDITTNIKDFNDILKLSNKKLEDIIPWKNPINKQQISQNALAKIQIISEVLNEGVILDFNNRDQYKYIPYFIKDAGLGWVFFSCDLYSYGSSDGFGCFYKSEKLAKFAGQKFLDIYIEYLP